MEFAAGVGVTMKLSDLDRRESCVLHGWVGRRAFQEDRHDLCEAPAETPYVDANEEEAPPDPDEDEAELVVDDVNDEDEAEEPPAPRRRKRGSARQRGIPPKKTLAVRRITQLELAQGRLQLRALGADEPYDRPRTRADCLWCEICQAIRDGKATGLPQPACGHSYAQVIWRSRPCVFVACKHALYLDTSETGSIILNFPHLEPGDMPPERSCSLDLASRRPMTLEEIAVVTNLTRERIRQVELKALHRHARPAAEALGLTAADAAALGTRHQVGPGADLEETGVEGALPSDIATLLVGGRDEER
jgi:hypothetical protein